jgi:hypothetical protein
VAQEDGAKEASDTKKKEDGEEDSSEEDEDAEDKVKEDSHNEAKVNSKCLLMVVPVNIHTVYVQN